MGRRQSKCVGAIPGYAGHVPCLRTHIIGRAFSDATKRADACNKLLFHDDYAAAIPLTVESRPQGREFLYAQMAPIDAAHKLSLKQAIVPRVSKRHPPPETFHASGQVDIRTMKKVVGTTEECVTKTIKTTSLPELAYRNRSLVTHKPLESVILEKPDIGKVPGYQGHQHGAQHIFSKSFGSTGRELIEDNCRPDKPTVKELLYFTDPRPTARALSEKDKIPGYQGFVPTKNNHIVGKTFGKASNLATVVDAFLKERGNACAFPEFVDNPPQGRVDLYAQSKELFHMPETCPLNVRVDKRHVKVEVLEKRPDYRIKERIEPDICEVMQGQHKINGYTGHVHALQHTYGKSFGKSSRALHDLPANPSTSERFLDYSDSRALIDQSENLLVA